MKRGLVLAGLLVLSLAGCGGGGDSPASGSGTVGDAPPATASAGTEGGTATPAPGPTTTDTTGHAAGNPLACTQLATAQVGSAAKPLADFAPGPVTLAAGRFTGSDGTVVELQSQCATGDLNGDGVGDALSVVKITSTGTGRFYTLVAWTSNNSGVPQLAASKALGDRNPVTDISIAAGKATVVYLTRTADVPLAGLNLKRTAIFQLSGGALTEVSHTDVSYTP
jgi:hypothetical protein